MTRITEAIYSQGVLRPVDDLGLREGQRVRVIVEALNESREDRAVALAKLKAGIATMQFLSDGPLPARDDWHDRLTQHSHLTRVFVLHLFSWQTIRT